MATGSGSGRAIKTSASRNAELPKNKSITAAMLEDGAQQSLVPVGSIVDHAGPVPPVGWVFAYGQAMSRTAYANLFNALTIQQTGTTLSGSPAITGLADTSNMAIGMFVSGPGVPGGATIVNVNTSSQITISANATSSGSGIIVVAPHGVGDGSTTFNVPDCRGRAMFGRDNMGGTAINRVTIGNSAIAGYALGAGGGLETLVRHSQNSGSLVTSAHTRTEVAHGHNIYRNTSSSAQDESGSPFPNYARAWGGGTFFQTQTFANMFAASASTNINISGDGTNSLNGHSVSGATDVTGTGVGGGSTHGNMPPAMIVNKIIKY